MTLSIAGNVAVSGRGTLEGTGRFRNGPERREIQGGGLELKPSPASAAIVVFSTCGQWRRR
jgi:hypothetical protein